MQMRMKRLLFLIAFWGTISSIWAQTVENLFEWQTNHVIVSKDKFLRMQRENNSYNSISAYKDYDVSIDGSDSYVVRLIGLDETTADLGSCDGFEIYHDGKRLLGHLAGEYIYNVESITIDADNSRFIKVPLSDNSFALFFGVWPYDGGDAPELVIAVVSGDKAKVVYDGRALAYKYTPVPNFSIEFVETVGNLYEKSPLEFTESFLKERTKHKIWREGNMLKYKSWK